MGVITISAASSARQLVSGIPQYITLSTNLTSVMFYTLDGTVPSQSSTVYVGQIEMPRDASLVRLRAFATNGIDTSGSLDVTYKTVITANIRLPQAKVTFLEDITYVNCAIGQSSGGVKVSYSQPHMNTVDSAGTANTSVDGYNADGSFPARGSDEPIPDYMIKHSETDRLGRTGRGIGTIPKTEIVYVPEPPGETRLGSKTFDPRAMVLFADSRDDTDTVHLFRPYFFDVHPEKNRIGTFYESFASDGHRLMSGSFISRHFNPKENTWTYYYRDSITNRWIISVEPASVRSQSGRGANLSNIYTTRQMQGSSYVFRWVLFRRVGII